MDKDYEPGSFVHQFPPDAAKRYPALIDGEDGAYGVVFPDIDGACAMGKTVNEALANAEDVLKDLAANARERGETLPAPSATESIFVPKGSMLATVALAAS